MPGPEFRLRPVKAFNAMGHRRFRVTGPRPLMVVNRPKHHPSRVRIALVLTGAPPTEMDLLSVENQECGLPPRPGWTEAVLGTTKIPETVLGVRVKPYTPRFNALLVAIVDLPPGESCLGLRFRESSRQEIRELVITNASLDPLFGWEVPSAGLFMIPVGGAECHLSDAAYVQEMRRSNRIMPELLLWGYFTQFVLNVMGGGPYPSLGILFLVVALFCFTASLVVLGRVRLALVQPDGTLPLGARAAPWLLLGPLLLHLISVVHLPTQSFAFPDAPYTALLMGALALLVLEQRRGFVLLGCLAAYARYPGAYVLAVALFTWLIVYKEGRRRTLGTLGWSLVGAGVVVALLALNFHLYQGIGDALRAVYFEVFPEHFDATQGGKGVYIGTVAMSTKVTFFYLKMATLSGFTLLFWPLVRHRQGALMIGVSVLYSLTLMGVTVPHSHYFQLLIYTTATAGLAGISRVRRAWIVPLVLVLFVVGLLGTLEFNDFNSVLLHSHVIQDNSGS